MTRPEHDLAAVKNWLYVLLALHAALFALTLIFIIRPISDHMEALKRELGTVHRMQQTLQRK